MFKKINNKGKFARKRQHSSSESGSESEPDTSVVRSTQRTKKVNPNIQKTSASTKWSSRKQREHSSSSGSSDEDEGKISVSYKSKRTTVIDGPRDQGATAVNEVETALDRDAQAIYEKSVQINKEQEGKADDKVYRGLNNYTQYYKKKDTVAGNASSGQVRNGPMRAPAHLRATVRWDYQPDVCKDYKETGFCGFGDSCKFLHDRSDYKHGWQLEQEHGNGSNQAGDESDGNDDSKYEIHSDDESLPFKCFICRDSFVDPIMTKCKHYFCEKCALDNYKKSTRCFVCAVQTNGVFNPAKELIAKIKRDKEEEAINSESDSN